MNHSPWLPEPARPLLLRHLGRLREAMQGLSERNREALARTLAGVVAGLVCEAVAGALTSPARRPARDAWPQREHRPGIPLLHTLDERDFHEPDYLAEDWDEPPRPRAASRRELERLPSPGWPAALAVGLRAAAWGLGRRKRRGTLLTALGLGAAATVGAALGGPLALAGLGLVESLLGLASLDTAARSAGALAGPDDRW